LTPSQTSGPFYFDVGLVRRDITEGRPGALLRLGLDLVEADTCLPIPNAVVDIWHTDAAGLYSGYPNQGEFRVDTSGETFMRGVQVTDANGRVEFETVYPGWYPGRVAHIHARIHFDDRTFLTSQLYFPEAVTQQVYGTGVYAARGQSPTTHATDTVLRSGQLDDLILNVEDDESELIGWRTVVVDLPETPAPTPTPNGACAGDCDGDGAVAIDELVRGVRTALGNLPVDGCSSIDADRNQVVSVSELVAAVNNALLGCR
jgi:hypothetical protein